MKLKILKKAMNEALELQNKERAKLINLPSCFTRKEKKNEFAIAFFLRFVG